MNLARVALTGLALLVMGHAVQAQTLQPNGDTVVSDGIVMFFYTLPNGNAMAIQTNPGSCAYGISYGPDAPDNPQSADVTGCDWTYHTNPDRSVDVYASLPQTTITLAVSGIKLTLNATTWHLHGTPIFRGLRFTMVSYSTGITLD